MKARHVGRSRSGSTCPGPFYTGWTDTCWTGRPLAPNNVLYSGDGDSACEEFVFCQPRDAAELAAVVAAAENEVYAGYACDGDQHWTPASGPRVVGRARRGVGMDLRP